jgi:hypothetical protein
MALPVLEAGRGGDVDRADADKSSASSGATARAAVVRVIVGSYCPPPLCACKGAIWGRVCGIPCAVVLHPRRASVLPLRVQNVGLMYNAYATPTDSVSVKTLTGDSAIPYM